MILALALPFVSADANDACKILSGTDYECLAQAACGGCTDFSVWCLSQGGSLTDGETDPACTQVCCCDADIAIATEPVSRDYCSDIITGPPACPTCQFQPLPTAGNTCEDVCSGSGGYPGTTYTVSGTVFNESLGGVPAARIQYPVGSTLVTVFTDINGHFSLSNVPAGTVNFKASRTGCGADFVTEDVTGDMTISFNLNCLGDCSVSAINDTVATPVPGSAAVNVAWTPTDCGGIQGYMVKRCVGTTTDCRLVAYVEPDTGTTLDTTVEADTEYCYSVEIINENGVTISQEDSGKHCVSPMDSYCLEGGVTRASCFNGAPAPPPEGATRFTGVAFCNASNQFHVTKTCAGDQACFFSNGRPDCGSVGHCELCNGPFGWFIDHAANVVLGNNNACETITGCILNNNGYAEDTYQPCNEIRSCHDYRTQEACEKGDGYDACGISASGCEWTAVPDLEEIGKGVCTDPSATAEAPCGECDTLFGFCNEELCETIIGQGDKCYFNEYTYMDGEPGHDTCVSKEEMACRYYDTAADCKNTSAVSVDVTWTGNDRTAGTHVLTPGTDLFAFETCRWIADATVYPPRDGYCVKDANQRQYNNGERIVDDCYEPEAELYPYLLRDCFRDNEPPVTSMPFSPGSWLDLTFFRQASIGPIVNDNTFPSEMIDSYFCLAPSGTDCGYPDTPWNGLVTGSIGAQAYTIKYYSIDPAGNLEAVHSIDVNIQDTNETILLQALLI